MQTSAIYQYPEIILAALLGLIYLIAGGAGTRNPPGWLVEPAKDVLLAMPASYRDWLSGMQIWSGWRTNRNFGQLAVIKVYLPLAALLLGFWLPLWCASIAAICLFLVPDLWLLLKVRKRQAEIRQALPQALDLLVLCADAGLGLDAALKRVAIEHGNLSAALNEEFLNLSRDILLGMERERAYQELYQRTGVEELKSLASALNQSSKLGLGIARVLRAQSEYIRTRQIQQLEKHAAKLPIYMAFPLWFLIMPALLVLLLAPSLITFFKHLGAQAPLT